MASTPHALIAGGGTAGHVFPGVAVARALEARGWRVSWIGRQASMEERLVEREEIEFHPLPAEAVVGKGPISKARALATLGWSAASARKLIRRLGARVVMGTGGYVSVPAAAGARLAGVPVVLLEPNARAGAANRTLSRWSKAAALAYDSARQDFRCPVNVTGTPVRPGFFAVGEPQESTPRVLILGGSQGALKLNMLLPEALATCAQRIPGLEVVHQVGRHEQTTRDVYSGLDLAGSSVEIVPFIEDVAGAMDTAQLVISRAGAVTLAEICAAGRPAVLFPLALAGAHQRQNAQALVDAGGAEMLDEASATPGQVADLVGGLLGDSERRSGMSRALRGLASRNAAESIADLLERHAREVAS
jgi:UDP-N-acetylglucosamine--N-acetylmuramyl-(pentapeptide) pyrophosphoryl-undecaprenol N-acetylglucosamine transferase